jgi:hypothetical protein
MALVEWVATTRPHSILQGAVVVERGGPPMEPMALARLGAVAALAPRPLRGERVLRVYLAGTVAVAVQAGMAVGGAAATLVVAAAQAFPLRQEEAVGAVPILMLALPTQPQPWGLVGEMASLPLALCPMSLSLQKHRASCRWLRGFYR